MIVRGDYGLPPWDVFHQGLSFRTPLTIGTAVIVVGAVLLIAMILFREPIGLGTVANVFVIGLALDALLYVFDEPSNTAIRVMLTLTGPLVVAVATGLYLGVHLGPGPRDGIMTALARRGITLWKARFGIEAAAFIAGIIMGGTVGWGTVWFLVAIGPAVQWSIGALSLPQSPGESKTQHV
jgi:uncharacterized membrane protein YczE